MGGRLQPPFRHSLRRLQDAQAHPKSILSLARGGYQKPNTQELICGIFSILVVLARAAQGDLRDKLRFDQFRSPRRSPFESSFAVAFVLAARPQSLQTMASREMEETPCGPHDFSDHSR